MIKIASEEYLNYDMPDIVGHYINSHFMRKLQRMIPINASTYIVNDISSMATVPIETCDIPNGYVFQEYNSINLTIDYNKYGSLNFIERPRPDMGIIVHIGAPLTYDYYIYAAYIMEGIFHLYNIKKVRSTRTFTNYNNLLITEDDLNRAYNQIWGINTPSKTYMNTYADYQYLYTWLHCYLKSDIAYHFS